MKIIIFFILAALSLAQEDFKCKEEPTPKGIVDCSLSALANYRELMKAFIIYSCEFRESFDKSFKNYNISGEKLIKALYCSGCPADEILGEDETFAEFGKKVGESIYLIGIPLGRIVDALVFIQPLTNTICALEEEALISDCGSKLIESDVPADVENLSKLFCENDLSLQDAIEIWKHLDCAGDQALHTGDLLEKSGEKVGILLKNALEDFIAKLKEKLKDTKIASKLLCPLVNNALSNELPNVENLG